ncbi:MAG: hypothetical protein PUE08_04605 [Eubacteriales bacterium]|nr:hypothetical protein [Eubacteriales bacterium]
MPIKFSDLFPNGQDSFNSEMFEDVFNKTRDVAESVSKKSVERIELQRKKVELINIKTKLSKLYEKYGKFMYGILIGDEIGDEVIHDIENQIAELREKAEVYSKEIEEAKAAFNETRANAVKHTYDIFSQNGKEAEAEGVDVTDLSEDKTEE